MTYIKNILKDKQIASITPTSAYGVRMVCSKIEFNQRNVIVEYGPATGVFSKFLLDQMTEHSKLILIERNANFVSILRNSFKDPRVEIYHDSAEYVNAILTKCTLTKANYIISGIPFSLMDEELRNQTVSNTYNALISDGKFLAYQTFFQKDKHLKEHMNQYFDIVKDEFCLLNAPPMRIYEALKL